MSARHVSLLLSAALLVLPDAARAALAQGAPAPGGFRIVVIAGEDAVNIVQQKTAVNPIVEVRDRNNLPVAGIAVLFTVSAGQGATFAGGASTLTVATNAAGQAVAAGLTPTTAGALTINASAVVQGQTIAATITQTNFATVAEALQAGAQVSGTGSSAGGAGGGAAGGSGGISGTTIGIVGGVAAAAGTLVATQVGKDSGGSGSSGGSSSSPPPTTSPAPAPAPAPAPTPTAPSIGGTYNGTMSGTYVTTIAVCTINQTVTGPVRIVLDNRTDGIATGTGTVTTTFSSPAPCNGVSTANAVPSSTGASVYTGPVTGSASSLRFVQEVPQTTSFPNGIGGTITVQWRLTFSFTGTISGNTMTGTATLNHTSTVSGPGASNASTGSGTFPLTLTR